MGLFLGLSLLLHAGRSLAEPALPDVVAPANAQGMVTADVVGAVVPPAGWTRLEGDAWGRWLGSLKLDPPGTPVTDYRGGVQEMRALRVVDLPLVSGDLQQCADSILRLRATWDRERGVDPVFRYTSGWKSSWKAWQSGVRPVVEGSAVRTVKVDPSTRRDGSFEAWLANLFMYAGTISLKVDTTAVAGGPAGVQPGDVVMYAGSPGHAVLVLAVAAHGEERAVLVGQGFMPAMRFHLVDGPMDGWFPVEGEQLATWPLPVPWSGLRRFPEST